MVLSSKHYDYAWYLPLLKRYFILILQMHTTENFKVLLEMFWSFKEN